MLFKLVQPLNKFLGRAVKLAGRLTVFKLVHPLNKPSDKVSRFSGRVKVSKLVQSASMFLDKVFRLVHPLMFSVFKAVQPLNVLSPIVVKFAQFERLTVSKLVQP